MRLSLLILALLVLGGCAYVGDPLPPALKVPSPVTDLSASQLGGELQVSFTIPAKTLEDLPLTQLGAIDLKIGSNPSQPFSPEQWSAAAQSVASSVKQPGKVELKLPAKDWANQEVILGVRLSNPKGRFSPWSNFITLKVVNPLNKPTQLRAVATAAGVAIEWANPEPRPALSWKLFRRAAGEANDTEMATVQQPKFLDTGAAFDTAYRYTVQAMEAEAISEMSDPLGITPEDKFAPVAPQGLSILAGPASAQLSWERNQEADLAIYRIYRALPNAPFTKIAESPSAANYRDNTVTAGQSYRYCVSAVDKKGNESPKSESVEILIP
jgi:hypothetical protein